MSEFFKQNWGNLASVAGFTVSVWVLVVARRARKAAEEARSLARLKSIVEDVESANNKGQQIGIYLRHRKWEVVELLASEMLGLFRSALARWGEHLVDAKSTLLDACRVLQSIVDSCRRSAARTITEEEWQQAMQAQREAAELISTALGQARKVEERSR